MRLVCVAGLGATVVSRRHSPPPYPVSSASSRCAAASIEASVGSETPAGIRRGGLSEAVAVLVDQYEASVPGDGRDVDPVGIFEDIVVGNAAAVGEFETLVAHGEPGSAEEVLAREDLPFAIFGVFHSAKIEKIGSNGSLSADKSFASE